jgi:hypothetical protein
LDELTRQEENKFMIEIKFKINKDEVIKNINDTLTELNNNPDKNDISYSVAASSIEENLSNLGFDTAILDSFTDYDMI